MSNRGPGRLATRLADLRANQHARRERIYPETELDELRACKRLAFELFGASGVVEFPCELDGRRIMGNLRISVFLEPADPKRPGVLRKTLPMFQGATYAELDAQVRLWKASR